MKTAQDITFYKNMNLTYKIGRVFQDSHGNWASCLYNGRHLKTAKNFKQASKDLADAYGAELYYDETQVAKPRRLTVAKLFKNKACTKQVGSIILATDFTYELFHKRHLVEVFRTAEQAEQYLSDLLEIPVYAMDTRYANS